MEIYSVSEARENLYRLVDQVSDSHKEIYITGKRHDAVMLSADDYRSIQETLFLLSIPNMRESILEGRKQTISECSENLDW